MCQACARQSLPILLSSLATTERCGGPSLPAQAMTCQSKGRVCLPLSSTIFFFFLPERGSGERDLSLHTTQALGKDMRTLDSFHRTLDEMARYGDPRGQDYSDCEWLRPAFQQLLLHSRRLSSPQDVCPTWMYFSVVQVSTVTTPRDFS